MNLLPEFVRRDELIAALRAGAEEVRSVGLKTVGLELIARRLESPCAPAPQSPGPRELTAADADRMSLDDIAAVAHIKPCPFCGGKSVRIARGGDAFGDSRRSFWIACEGSGCGASGPSPGGRSKADCIKAISAWNAIPRPPATDD